MLYLDVFMVSEALSEFPDFHSLENTSFQSLSAANPFSPISLSYWLAVNQHSNITTGNIFEGQTVSLFEKIINNEPTSVQRYLTKLEKNKHFMKHSRTNEMLPQSTESHDHYSFNFNTMCVCNVTNKLVVGTFQVVCCT